MQGGIHPDYTGATSLQICRAVKAAAPDIHIHAFSPLEVHQGAATLGMPAEVFLLALKDAGLPDKINTERWLDVVRQAHRIGLRTTATIMFGHIDRYQHWARHLLRLRALQAETGGFTELVPLPFVHMEAPIYLKGRARKVPTFREDVLMHAVARLALHPLIVNIQTSWVKMGSEGAKGLPAGRRQRFRRHADGRKHHRAAGAIHGQEMKPALMESMIRAIGRRPRQRTTRYGTAPPERYWTFLPPDVPHRALNAAAAGRGGDR